MADATKNSKLSVTAEALIEAASLESDAITPEKLADNLNSLKSSIDGNLNKTLNENFDAKMITLQKHVNLIKGGGDKGGGGDRGGRGGGRANEEACDNDALESVFDKLSIKASTTSNVGDKDELSSFFKRVLMPDDFSSYEDLKMHTIALIVQVGKCASLLTHYPDIYKYFRELLQRHPDAKRKKVALITDIIIKVFPKAANKRQPLQTGDYQIWYRTSDGLEDSISWVKSMRKEDYSISKKLTSAMRYSIEGQVRLFRQSNLHVRCQYCNTNRKLTVHHINHFEGLAYNFLLLHPTHPVEFTKAPITSQKMFRLEDAAYNALWKEYHSSNANLQILCNTCNQARPEWKHPSGEIIDKRWKPTW